jgi:hypothetical protein
VIGAEQPPIHEVRLVVVMPMRVRVCHVPGAFP